MWFVFATLLNISDRYLITYYLDLSKVGEYSAVYDLIYKSMVFLLSPLLMALHPQVVKCFNEGYIKEASYILRRAIFFELVIFIVVLVILTSLKKLLVTGLLGLGAETKATNLVIPIFIGSFLWQIAMLFHKPMELKKQTKKMLLAVLIALAANIAGNILLIPIYGSVAAAYTTILGSAVYILANYQSLISILYSKSKYLAYEN
jgi:O-antigen/teichoic acid export membrane protein